MTYNGIGLVTPRGSGTCGYVTRNMSQLRNHKDKVNYKTEEDLAKLDQHMARGPNLEILDHERKRKVELKCLEMQELMEEQGYSADEIESKVSIFRKMLTEKEGVSSAVERDELGRPTGKETHQIAAANKEKNDQLRAAFGLSQYYVDGSSFDPERRAKEQKAKTEALTKKKYEIVHSESASSRSPSPEERKKKKKKKERSHSSSPDKRIKRHKGRKERSHSPNHDKNKSERKSRNSRSKKKQYRESSESESDSSNEGSVSSRSPSPKTKRKSRSSRKSRRDSTSPRRYSKHKSLHTDSTDRHKENHPPQPTSSQIPDRSLSAQRKRRSSRESVSPPRRRSRKSHSPRRSKRRQSTSRSRSRSRSRSSSIRRRKGSPSHLERRRITRSPDTRRQYSRSPRSRSRSRSRGRRDRY